MFWAIGIGTAAVVWLIVSKLDSIIRELEQIRLLLNESESEKFRRKREEYRAP